MTSEGEKIQTFVIVDSESTGLQSLGRKPRITEICLLAYGRNELLTKTKHPRVCNKLVLCFDPLKPIEPKSAEISGLFNDALEGLPTFKKQCSLIISFLQSLPSPVCLVAHNGYRFDFALLKAQLMKSKRETEIDNILCADSVWVFRNLDGLPAVPEQYRQHDMSGIGMPKNGEFSTPVKSTDTLTNDIPKPLKRGASLISHPESSVKKRLFVKDGPADSQCPSSSRPPSENDTSTASGQVSSTSSDKPDGESEIGKKNGSSRVNSLPPKYRLQNLYRHYFHQEPEVAHAAEDDCITLLKVLRLKCRDFLAWCDENAIPFKDIQPMYMELKQ